jgi:hypothetical protein
MPADYDAVPVQSFVGVSDDRYSSARSGAEIGEPLRRGERMVGIEASG